MFPCDLCGGSLEYLGTLGRRVFGRCRHCGSLQGIPVCHECIGSGSLYDELTTSGDVVCPECDGTGERPTAYPPAVETRRT